MISCKFVRILAKLSPKFSNPLILMSLFRQIGESGAPRRIRTPDPLIRSQVLYPAELSVPLGRE